MRPDKLFALFYDVERLKGVGPSARKTLGRLFHGSDSHPVILRDLMFHLPVSVVDRRNSPALADAEPGDIVTVIATVETHQPPPKKRGAKLPYRVICHTAQGFLTLVFFTARTDYLTALLPVGTKKAISGRFERYNGIAQITHPDIIAPAGELAKIQSLEPVYGLTAGLSNRQLGKIIQAALAYLPDLPEWLDAAFVKAQQFVSWKNALLAAHAPKLPEDLSPLSGTRRRLAYDEILANQLALALVRNRLRQNDGATIRPSGHVYDVVYAGLPFALTQGQKEVLAEIEGDLFGGQRMLRLLQGDVGSGKTVVALLAILRVLDMGRQAALIVPTELLGKQHFASITRLLKDSGVTATLLTGSIKQKAEVLAQIASGEAQIVIGTHALLQEKVVFHDLGLAVIDEQHRFGVAQRMALTAKGQHTHMLVMTATPIPRTLAMTAFGDMDCSVLMQKPVGRLPIATKAVPLSRAEEVLEGITRAIAKGEKVYWICPLVEESDDENLPSDLAAAEARHTEFVHRFGPRVGLAHGRMAADDRDKVMEGFAGSQYDILVATTVVEVGVDVPDATIIVIEHAERFGLSQLHQLRGRVGRSAKPSVCLLLYADRCGDIAKQRLQVIRQSNDGFFIAEEDLKLRGSGDILGTRQSGLPDFHFADLSHHYDLMRAAHDDAKLILHRDPLLQSERGTALRVLLYLFGYDENIRFLAAG